MLENKNYYPNGWYVIASSNEIFSSKPNSFKRFGLNLVAWRDQTNHPVVMIDSCPHRSAKLSLGSVTNNCIECPFHGFRFNANGACELAPEIEKPAPGIKVRTFETKEMHGLIWVWYSNDTSKSSFEPSWFEDLPQDATFSTIHELVKCHMTRAIENQIDYSHLRFVHKKTIGRMASPPSVKPTMELKDDSIKFWFKKGENKAETKIYYKKPNIWINQISKKFFIFLAFAPVDEKSTLIYMRSYQSFLKVPVLRQIVNKTLNIMNRYILREDARIVKTHPVGSSLNTGQEENLFFSDRPIRHFRKIYHELK